MAGPIILSETEKVIILELQVFSCPKAKSCFFTCSGDHSFVFRKHMLGLAGLDHRH